MTFPFLFGRAFIEASIASNLVLDAPDFPTFVGTFIEAVYRTATVPMVTYFPSYLEGLSLRQAPRLVKRVPRPGFPYLFGGTFNKIEQYPFKVTAGPFVLQLEV